MFVTAVQLRHGEGTYEYVSKGHSEETPVTYKGGWENNLKSGIGKQIYADKGIYNGYWQDGLRHGEGVMTYKNTDLYSGNWVKGEKEGKGTYIFEKTGQKYTGIFMKGQMVNGQWIYPNGTSFHGNFENNKPKGKGTWSFENGNVVDGAYRQMRRADTDATDDIKITWTTAS